MAVAINVYVEDDRLKVCCTVQLMIFLSLDGISSERLKVCCAAWLLIFPPRWR